MRRVALSISVLLLVSSLVQADEKRLSGAEIKALLSGNTAFLDNGAIQTFSEDGATLYFHEPRPIEKGSWKIDGNDYCSEWSGRWTCYQVTGDGNNRITWISGSARYPAQIKPGIVFR